MEKKIRRSMHNILTMAFTFAMVLVFAGFIGKMNVNAESGTATVTVTLKDNNANIISEQKGKNEVYLELWQACTVGSTSAYKSVDTVEYTNYLGEGKYEFTFNWNYEQAQFVSPGANVEEYQNYSITDLNTDAVMIDTDGNKCIKSSRMSRLPDYDPKQAEYVDSCNGTDFVISLTPQTNAEKI